MDLEKIIYYLNQGGPVGWTVLVYGGYQILLIVQNFLAELKTTNDLLKEQNDLMKKVLDKNEVK